MGGQEKPGAVGSTIYATSADGSLRPTQNDHLYGREEPKSRFMAG